MVRISSVGSRSHHGGSSNATIQKVGDSLGAPFPKAMLDRQGLTEGSGIVITETPNGLLISPDDSEFAEAMAAYEVVAEQYKNALRELAK